MRGTRYGDFTRFPFDPDRRYGAVRMQQGRVQLDADWNEQADIEEHRARTTAADVLGASGAPAAAPGFGITVERHGVELGTGGTFLLIGGADGAALPPGRDGGWGVEVVVVAGSDGPVVSLWARPEAGGKFRLNAGLQLEEGCLRLQRAGIDDLVAPVRGDLYGRLLHLAVSAGPDGSAILVDGRVVAEDASGAALEPGRTLLLVGARQDPRFHGVVTEVRLWGERPPRERLLDRRRATSEATDGLHGWWRCAEVEGDRLRDRGPLGLSAVVRGEAGRAPRLLPAELSVGAGRFYVDGVLCRNPVGTPLTAQPDLPSATLPLPRGGGRESHLLYLDTWERTVSAVEEPGLAESALGGADTANRDRVLAQVRSVPLSGEVAAASEAALEAAWSELAAPLTASGGLSARRRQPATRELGNWLYRVEVHTPGDGHRETVSQFQPGGRRLVLAGWDDGWRAEGAVEVVAGAGPEAPRQQARLAAIDPGEAAVHLDAELRAEVVGAGELSLRRIASFKWSRSNGSVTFALRGLDAATGLAEVAAAGRGLEGLEVGAWVEVVDDRVASSPEAHPLCRVAEVDPLAHTVILAPPPPAHVGTDPALRPFLRVWDQRGRALAAGTVPALGGWQDLEDGIQVRFTYDGPYRTGDYWWVPARTLAQDIEWSLDAAGLPATRPPDGVEHRFAPLALLTYEAGGFRLDDLRRTFQPYSSDAVSKGGDWMAGPLEVRADAAIRGDLRVAGEARLDRIHGRLASPDAVGSEQLVDGAVTPRKLSPAVGTVPPGWSILGPVPAAPPGFEETGVGLTLWPEEPVWQDRLEIPSGPPGPLVSAAVGGRVVTLLESGTVWEYEPAGNRWARRRELPVSLVAFAAAAIGGRLFVAGGLDAVGRPSRHLFEYDPKADGWIERASLPTPRAALGLVAFDGRLHAVGGVTEAFLGQRASARHEVYDPLTDSWRGARSLPRPLVAPGAAAAAGKISVAGGERRLWLGRWGRAVSAAHLQYDPAADRWSAGPPLPTPRRAPRLATVGGKLVAVGGEGALGWLADCDLFDPQLAAWLPRTPLHEPIEAPGVAAVEGTLYVTGAMRAPGRGVLVEACPVAPRFFLHRRRGVAPEVEPGEPKDDGDD